MDGWLVKLQTSLNDGQLLRGAIRVLVGVSGGPDSIALLRLLSELRDAHGRAGFPELLAGHVHHGLRGVEADRDEGFVRECARAWNVELVVARGDADAVARRGKLSREAAARVLRYDAFREWARELRLDAIALAHHLDDQAETVLLRATRGAGVRGLAGIPRERLLGGLHGARVRIIRPFLVWRRAEILDFLRSRGQEFRTDASNEDRSVPRNCIRHEILPLLERGVHPGAAQALARVADLARTVARDLEILARRALSESRVDSDGSDVELSVERLREWPWSVTREALRLVIAERSPGLVFESRASRVLASWLESDRATEGRIDLGIGDGDRGGVEIELRYGRLHVRRSTPAADSPFVDDEATLPVPGSIAWRGWELSAEARAASGVPPGESGPLEEELDADRIAASGALRVRARRDGDRFWPLGAPGPKKLKEHFRSEHVAPRERDGVPLVSSGDAIVWVVGHRIAHAFRVTPETRRVVVLRARRT